MKKYLMTGMAALAICAAFTSCSKETNVYNPDQPKQDIQLSYDQAFVKVFGQPAADQDWGFGTAAKTRATTYMNGNMEKYYNAPTRGENEETDVEAYVHSLTSLPAKAAPDWKTYFVTQIHEGKASYNTQKTVDNTTEYVAGNQMDELAFAMQEGAIILDNGLLQGDWIHINNFNSADNTDWNGNTLVEDGGTVDFAYKSSADSKYHNRWIGIDGKDVPNAQGVTGDYDDYYYICFDFESTGNAKTVIKWRDANNNPQQAYLFGSWTNIDDVPTGTTIYNTQWNPGTNSEDFIPTGTVVREEGTSSWELDNVVGGNMVVEGNNDYTDWIVRLYKAKKLGDETPNYSIRVIGEDLTFGSDLDTDFDFNDVVFDVALNVPNKTFIKVKAAGGTLPIIIGIANPDNSQDYTDNEIHHILGINNTSIMINTNADAAGYANRSATAEDGILELTTTYSNAKDIPVFVKKNGVWVELTAIKGEPASKIGVDTTFQWCDERVSLKSDYPLFIQWVESAGAERVKWY